MSVVLFCSHVTLVSCFVNKGGRNLAFVAFGKKFSELGAVLGSTGLTGVVNRSDRSGLDAHFLGEFACTCSRGVCICAGGASLIFWAML